MRNGAIESRLRHQFKFGSRGWLVETTKPHDLEGFCIELGIARWNDLRFVPLRTFGDVLTDITAIHKLENWEPEKKTEKYREFIGADPC